MCCKNKLSEAARSNPGCEKLAEIAPAAIKTCLGRGGISAPLAIVLVLLHPDRKGRKQLPGPKACIKVSLLCGFQLWNVASRFGLYFFFFYLK